MFISQADGPLQRAWVRNVECRRRSYRPRTEGSEPSGIAGRQLDWISTCGSWRRPAGPEAHIDPGELKQLAAEAERLRRRRRLVQAGSTARLPAVQFSRWRAMELRRRCGEAERRRCAARASWGSQPWPLQQPVSVLISASSALHARYESLGNVRFTSIRGPNAAAAAAPARPARTATGLRIVTGITCGAHHVGGQVRAGPLGARPPPPSSALPPSNL